MLEDEIADILHKINTKLQEANSVHSHDLIDELEELFTGIGENHPDSWYFDTTKILDQILELHNNNHTLTETLQEILTLAESIRNHNKLRDSLRYNVENGGRFTPNNLIPTMLSDVQMLDEIGGDGLVLLSEIERANLENLLKEQYDYLNNRFNL